MSTAPNFNRIARAYRWLEYASFGPLLERARFCFLPRLSSVQHALVFGDGDGRFLAQLLRINTTLTADAVDASGPMLSLLRQRCPADGRLTTHHQDARTFLPERQYDLVATHFFLDCLTDAETAELIERVQLHLTPGALWIVSEFDIPANALRLPAHLLIRSLYTAFRALTGLQPQRLPQYASALRSHGFSLQEEKRFAGGLLLAQLWQAPN